MTPILLNVESDPRTAMRRMTHSSLFNPPAASSTLFQVVRANVADLKPLRYVVFASVFIPNEKLDIALGAVTADNLVMLYVRPEYRGQAVGTRLLKHIKERVPYSQELYGLDDQTHLLSDSLWTKVGIAIR